MSRTLNLEAAVEHFSTFWRFCSTFRTAHPGFGEPGRQKSHISPGFCLLSRPRPLNFDQPVDKKEAFLPFFVYFWYRAPRFRRTAEIPPKQETLRRCLMPVALHFEFPSRKLSRFVAVRASKAVRASSKALHYRQQKKRPATCRFGLGRVAKTISNFPR